MSMYVKHPDWMGKDLKLHVGRGDQTVFDNAILEGPKWEKFVGMGFLRRCTDEEVAAIKRGRAAAAAPAPEPEPAKKPSKKEQAAAKKKTEEEAAKAAAEEQARQEAAAAEAKAREEAAKANEGISKSPAAKVQPSTGRAKKRSTKKSSDEG